MAIYNLGQAPQQEANPYMDSLMKYFLQSELQGQQLEGQKEVAKIQTLDSAKQLVAQEELKKASANSQNFTKTWQTLSDKPQDKRAMFLETDSGKEYLKVAKKYIPEVFDTEGKPIFFPSTEEKVRTELDQQIDATKIKMTKDPNSLTAGETKLLEMEGYKDEVAQVSAELYKNGEFMALMQAPDELYDRRKPQLGTNAEVANKVAQTALQQRINMRKSQQPGAVVSNPLTDALVPGTPPVANQATPKATRFKVQKLN